MSSDASQYYKKLVLITFDLWQMKEGELFFKTSN